MILFCLLGLFKGVFFAGVAFLGDSSAVTAVVFAGAGGSFLTASPPQSAPGFFLPRCLRLTALDDPFRFNPVLKIPARHPPAFH